MDFELNTDYHLSTEGYHFRYRKDIHNPGTVRADLFNSDGEVVDKLIVKGGIINADFNHHDIINAFEARLIHEPVKFNN